MIHAILSDPESLIVHSTHERESAVIKDISEMHYNKKLKDFGEKLAQNIGNKIFYDEIDTINIEWNRGDLYKMQTKNIIQSRYIDTSFGKLNLLLVFNKLNEGDRNNIANEILLFILDGENFSYNLNLKLTNIIKKALQIEPCNVVLYGLPYKYYLLLKKMHPNNEELCASWFY